MVSKKRRRNTPPLETGVQRPGRTATVPVAGLRIIGGRFRGRRLEYSGALRTRPMKDRVREAVFNLIGPSIRDCRAIDLFAGTGALALEALSRGARRATLIERHHPTADVIRRNAARLGVEAQTEIVAGDVFVWLRRGGHGPAEADSPWAVFCSPPYDFYIEQSEAMRELIVGLMQAAPGGSVFAVEADARFDFTTLPDATSWDVRAYPPAVIGIYRKP